MSMKRDAGVQNNLTSTWADMPLSSDHAFYDRLNKLLSDANFDTFVEAAC
ncbi:hypothetical protein GGD83_002543 [Rhodoblastus sphagnicola]|nr:hypothetical protein [Rhodoblastus sphagnicola]